MITITTDTCDRLEHSLSALSNAHADLLPGVRAALPPDDLVLETSDEGHLTGSLGGARLASRRDPIGEGKRLAERVDVVANATVVVLGLGVGHHVRALAERLRGTGLIIVVEPNLGLLRAMLERTETAAWLRTSNIVIVNDPDDPALLARRLQGADALLFQGLTFLEHPASVRRLGAASAQIRRHLAEYLTAAKTNLATSLLRSVETVRNITLNLPWHAAGPGIDDLKGAATGSPAVLVSAGPSLRRNIHRLAEPGVRERCVVIAAQTALKPLLKAGVRPHFVTALDYHEISRRFYEGVSEADLKGVTLIADPKANPEILDAFRGTVRCFDIPFLRELLGEDHPRFGELPAGATVAHLSLYLARYLGCDRIAMIGQDLGFPDALYYAPGTAIHEVWGPELNPFNTIANMEWQRIARQRLHLHRKRDVHGRMIHTDVQMLAYLQQFERDFLALREAGVRVFDASEGGVAKRHVEQVALADFLAAHATGKLQEFPVAPAADPSLRKRAAARLREMARDVEDILASAKRTVGLLRSMRAADSDAERLTIYRSIERERRAVEKRPIAFSILNQMNQLGAFRRSKADRRIELLRDEMTKRELEDAQIDRDIDNVAWIEEAGKELTAQLRAGRARLEGRTVSLRGRAAQVAAGIEVGTAVQAAALIPIAPWSGIADDPMRPIAGVPALHRTLDRLERMDGLSCTVLLVPENIDAERLIGKYAAKRPIHLMRCGASPFGPEHRAVRAARHLAGSCWRGGVAGMSIWDEVLAPARMLEAMERHHLTAAMIAGPDWIFLRAGGRGGGSDLIARHREQPDLHRLVFTQAAPGLSACLVNRSLMEQLCGRSRLGTVGALLVHQPSVPQADPVQRDANVHVPDGLRTRAIRAIPDSPLRMAAAEHVLGSALPNDDEVLLARLAEAEFERISDFAPEQLLLEVTTRGDDAESPLDLAQSVVSRLCAWSAASGGGAVTFGGRGDALLAPDFAALIEAARAAGARTIHVRTDLRRDGDVEQLIAQAPEIISVRIDADRPETYNRLHGDDLHQTFARIERLVRARTALSGPPGYAAIALPWIVPRLERRAENVEEIERFHDRWQHLLGTAVIDAAAGGTGPVDRTDGLVEAVTPPAIRRRVLESRLHVRADGTVPLVECGPKAVPFADAASQDPGDLWRALIAKRRTLSDDAMGMIHA